jgi:AcrR family transcriptional regulator
MEDIASEAGLSRAALYLQFHNKEDIFRELARGLHEDALVQAEAALQKTGSLADRLRAAVEAKTLRMVEIASSSPHGSELMDEKNRLCGDLATDTERRFQEMIAATLLVADKDGEIDLKAIGLNAADAADLFARSLHGLKDPESTMEEYRGRLANFSRLFVAGLQP